MSELSVCVLEWIRGTNYQMEFIKNFFVCIEQRAIKEIKNGICVVILSG